MKETGIKKYILEELLESPKTTGVLAKQIKEKYDKGNGKYNGIKPDLDQLVSQKYGYIQSKKIKKKGVSGATPTTYFINYKLSIIKEIYNNYPTLEPKLRNNVNIGVLIRDFILTPEQINDLFEDGYSSTKLYHINIPDYFKLSPGFFKYCLFNDFYTIMKCWEDFHFLTPAGVSFIKRPIHFKGQTNQRDFETWFFEVMETICEHFIRNDALTGQATPEAKEYLTNKISRDNKQSQLNNSILDLDKRMRLTKLISPQSSNDIEDELEKQFNIFFSELLNYEQPDLLNNEDLKHKIEQITTHNQRIDTIIRNHRIKFIKDKQKEIRKICSKYDVQIIYVLDDVDYYTLNTFQGHGWAKLNDFRFVVKTQSENGSFKHDDLLNGLVNLLNCKIGVITEYDLREEWVKDDLNPTDFSFDKYEGWEL